ncbi:MAG: ABC transporter permease [Actinomycetia bacterium]|nr:ABC transporter permease [Actinomycetes bacterium]
MNKWNLVWLLAKREFVERGRSKAFLITMAILAAAILAIGPVTSALSGGESEATTVGLVGDSLPGVDEELETQGALFGVEIEVTRYASMDEAESALEVGDVEAVLVDNKELVFQEKASPGLTTIIIRSVDIVLTEWSLSDLGLSDAEIAAIEEPAPVSVSTIEESNVQDDAKQGAAFVGAILLYVSIIMFGQFVAMGTVEEKQNRVVEIVLSRVQPWQVLMGKVSGIGLLGLVQLAILLSAAFVSAQLAGFTDIDIAAIGLPIIAGVFFWFVLGYAFYAFLYAAVGSTVSRQEDLQGAIILPIALILPGYLLAIAAAENPDGVVVRIGSMMPMWAPFVMPVRIASGSAAPWEIGIAVIGCVLGSIALVRIGSRVYTGALLRTGTKVKIRDAWRAASE